MNMAKKHVNTVNAEPTTELKLKFAWAFIKHGDALLRTLAEDEILFPDKGCLPLSLTRPFDPEDWPYEPFVFRLQAQYRLHLSQLIRFRSPRLPEREFRARCRDMAAEVCTGEFIMHFEHIR